MSKPLIKRLATSDGDFIPTLEKLVAWNTVSDATIESRVAEIIQQVRSQGDRALVEYSNQFDRRTLKKRRRLLCVLRSTPAGSRINRY